MPSNSCFPQAKNKVTRPFYMPSKVSFSTSKN